MEGCRESEFINSVEVGVLSQGSLELATTMKAWGSFSLPLSCTCFGSGLDMLWII